MLIHFARCMRYNNIVITMTYEKGYSLFMRHYIFIRKTVTLEGE